MEVTTERKIRPEDLAGRPGLSRATRDALLSVQPTTVKEALRIPGVGRKTTKYLLGSGLLTDPDSFQRGTPIEAWHKELEGFDDAPEVVALFANLRASVKTLQTLLDQVNGHWAYEDGLYRLYHQSFKVYSLQTATTEMVAALQALAPERPLNKMFMTIVASGTGIAFTPEHNKRWLEVTRPIVEAFLHARFFLEMAVKHGTTLRFPPKMMPSGWAALLYLYGLR